MNVENASRTHVSLYFAPSQRVQIISQEIVIPSLTPSTDRTLEAGITKHPNLQRGGGHTSVQKTSTSAKLHASVRREPKMPLPRCTEDRAFCHSVGSKTKISQRQNGKKRVYAGAQWLTHGPHVSVETHSGFFGRVLGGKGANVFL
ncbi:uncharacterized protein CLUP02_12374 [Colletotrichum lupini]|uniref:Uncharacterized protein n=1 Tax=Colletotrichum lupini TaxID=145971 RepID=A0A9Q8WL69_9PEZI|nr:uncharacterized protein CLUP02_12374 [Colletotrichum lupini]UQC86872.1 hypothetical protein CLUP02_12374 [Colletotrichum lupini]